jgi:hypothetical protein
VAPQLPAPISPFIVLRAIKDTPLTVLVALYIKQTPVTQSWICSVLDYAPQTVKKALDFLAHSNYIRRDHYRAWQLEGGQLPLPGFPPPEMQNFAISASTTTTTPIIEGKVSQRAVAVEEEAPNAIICHFTPQVEEIIYALQGAGIGRTMRESLAVLPHVTLEYITAHIAKAKHENTPTGLLIHRIREADPMPVEHDKRRTGLWARFRYREWRSSSKSKKYGHLIQT